MKLVELTIKNFMAVDDAVVQLADRGLVLIQGENLDDPSADSNGAGKSTIADAIRWCFYGATARGVSSDAVVNKIAGKNCSVSIMVRDGTEEYNVSRYRKHSTFKNSLRVHHGSTDITKGTDKLTQDLLEKILGCTAEVFDAAVYSAQEAMPNLPGMTDKELKLLIEEAAGSKMLEKAYEIARERLSTAKAFLDKAQTVLDGAFNRRTMIDKNIKDAIKRRDDWFENQRKQVAAMKSDALSLAPEIKGLNEKIASIPEASIRSELAGIDAKLAAVAKEKIEERRLSDTLTTTSNVATRLKTLCDTAQADMERANSAKAHIHKRVGTKCSECGKEYNESDLADADKLADVRVADCTKLLDEKATALNRARESASVARTALEMYRASMTDVSAQSARATTLRASLDELAKLKTWRATLFEKVKGYVDGAKRLAADLNPHIATIEDGEKAYVEADEEVGKATVVVAKTEAKVKVYDLATKVYGPAGVRAHILDNVTPYLNARTARYLNSLSDGNITAIWSTLSKTAKGEIRERFAIDVTNVHGAESFAGLSGGEKRKVRLACALALQDLVASRATKPIDLWLGDEIDDALDSAGLERLMTILQEKARERGTVMVISHRNLKDWIDEVMVVRKEGGKSRILA